MILRSEVKFRRPREGAIDFDKRIESIEVAKGFEILHVSLLREYIDLEFQDLKDNVRDLIVLDLLVVLILG